MLDFTNAKVLSMNVENKFFGEAFRYGTTRTMTIQGSIYDLTNDDGIAGVWSGISGVVNSANDYDDILLRGVSFGPGRIDSVRFSEGIDVRQKEYQVTVTVFESGNLFNMSGQYWSGLDMSKVHLIDRFSENFEISVAANRDWTSQQQISCKFNANMPNSDMIQTAKAFASGLFASRPQFGFLTTEFSGWHALTGRRLFRETYNLTSNECTFAETLYRPAAMSGNYAAQLGYQVNLEERGIITVEERGTIRGLVDPIDVTAESGFSETIVGAYLRCQAEYAAYPLSTSGLNAIQTSYTKRINKFEGTIDYAIAFSNDPSIHAYYAWEFTQEIRRENCINYITENGRIRGISTNCTFADRYQNALNGYQTITGGFQTRAQSFIPGITSLRQTSRSETKSVYNGEISYSVTYSDQLVNTTSGVLIRKIETETEDEMPVHLVNKFAAFGFGGTQGKEVVQPAGISTPGRRSANVRVYGYQGVDRTILLNAAKAQLNSVIPTGDTYVTTCGYSFDVTNNIVSARADWTFFADYAFTSITV